MDQLNDEFFGEWKAYKSDNFDAFLSKVGVPWIARKFAANATPSIVLTKLSDNSINVKNLQTFGGSDETLTIGVEGTFKPPVGDAMKIIVEIENGKIVTYFSDVNNDKIPIKETGNTNVRELLDNGEMLLTVTWDKVIAKRWWKKVK